MHFALLHLVVATVKSQDAADQHLSWLNSSTCLLDSLDKSSKNNISSLITVHLPYSLFKYSLKRFIHIHKSINIQLTQIVTS